MKRNWVREEGQSLVEFALTFSMLMVLALGIADFAYVVPQYVDVTQAANAGVLNGSASATAAANTSAIRSAAKAVTTSWHCKDNTDGSPVVSITGPVSDGSLVTGSTTTYYQKLTVTVTCQPKTVTGVFKGITLAASSTRRVQQ